MKDFAKSIVCNSVTEKEFNTEADLRRWCMDHNYTYTPVGGGYYRLEDDSGKNRRDMEAHVSSETGNSTEKLFYGLKDDAEKEEEKSDEALDELKKTGNFKTGKSVLKPGDRVQSYGVQGTVRKVEGEDSDNIYGEPIIEVEWDNGAVKKVGEHYLRKIGNKVGNSKVGNRIIEKESEMSQELKNLLKKAPEWIKEKIRFAFSHGFTIDENDFINAIKKEVGNSKIGNQSPQERLNQDLSIIKEKCREKGVSLSFSELAKELEKYGWDFNELRKLKLPVSIGNSASDDKFAYVMREFEEGKLKTPDGKVVTDPAQAKAIAYSESKKTENGLARARNAMNPVIYKGYTIRYRPNTGKYYISSGPNDTYVAKFAYKEYSSEQDAKDAIDGSR